MARAKVVHSDDAVKIIFKGNPKNPEPSTGVLEFPGGNVEVSRCSDGSYWVHTTLVDPKNIVRTRIDHCSPIDDDGHTISSIPNGSTVTKIAVQVSNTVPRFDPS